MVGGKSMIVHYRKYLAVLALLMLWTGSLAAQVKTESVALEFSVAVQKEGVLFVAMVSEAQFGQNKNRSAEMMVLTGKLEQYPKDTKGNYLIPVSMMVGQTGSYALKLFLDTNGNQELDSGIFGPTEPYGFSNNARQPFGPPEFKEARFELKGIPLKLATIYLP